MSQHITNPARIPYFHSLSQPRRSQGIKEAHNSWSGSSVVLESREVTAMALPASSRCKAMMGGLGFRSNRGILDRSLTSNGSKRGNEGRKMRRNRWLRRVSALGPKPNFRKLIPISWSGKDRSPSPLLFFFNSFEDVPQDARCMPAAARSKLHSQDFQSPRGKSLLQEMIHVSHPL